MNYSGVEGNESRQPTGPRHHAPAERLRIAKTVKAYVTPEAVVIDGLGRVLYRGRIDDRFAAIGKKRVVPQREDLRLALKSIAVDQPVDIAITQAVGCRITY